MMYIRYNHGAYDSKPEEKEAYEEAVMDVWLLFRDISYEEKRFLNSMRNPSPMKDFHDSTQRKNEAEIAMGIIEKTYPELFKTSGT